MKKKKKVEKTYHHGDLASACVNAGIKFLAEGKSNFSLRDIAKEVGVSHGAPNRHFGNKEGLMAAIAQEGFKIFNEYLDRASGETEPKHMFFKMGHAYVEFGLNHPEHYRMMFGKKVHDHDDYEDLKQESRQSFEKLLHMVKFMQEQDLIAPGNPLFQAYEIWSGMHGLVSLFIEGPMNIGIAMELISDKELNEDKAFVEKLINDLCESMYLGLTLKHKASL